MNERGIEERVADVVEGHAPKLAGQRYGAVTINAMVNAIAKIPLFKMD